MNQGLAESAGASVNGNFDEIYVHLQPRCSRLPRPGLASA